MDTTSQPIDEGSALTNPADTIRDAQAQLREEAEPVRRAHLLHVLAIAYRATGSSSASIAALHDAIEIAENSLDSGVEGDLMLTLSGSLATAGMVDDALATLELAEQRLRSDHQPRAWVQRGTLVARSGSFAEALELFGRAERSLTSADDRFWLARLLSNRALIRGYSGEYHEAENDLRLAIDIGIRLGLDGDVADNTHNLGWVRSRQGDIVGAIELFDEAEAMLNDLNYPLNELLVDRAEVLITARLLAEALETAARAVEEVQAHGNPIDVPEAWVMYARAALAGGHADQAAKAAATARQGFVSLEAVGWQAIAQLLEVEAEADRGPASPELAETAIVTATDTGWRVAAFDGELLLASMATANHDTEAAIDALQRADALLPADRQPATLRAKRLATEAFAWAAAGEPSNAEEKATEALTVLAEFRAAIAATDLRASTSELAVDVVHLLVDLLDEQGRYTEMVEVVDTARASITNPPPVNRPADPSIAPLLGSVRELASEARGATTEDDAIPETLVEAERTYEAAVRPTAQSRSDLSVPADVVGLAFMSGTDQLIGVTIDGATATHSSTTALDELHRHLDELRATLGHPLAQWHDVERIASSIDELLIADDLDRGRSLVISPPAWMVTFPWTLLPSLRDRPVTIAPRLSNYIAAENVNGGVPTSALLVAGPHLQTGIQELGRIGTHYSNPQILPDPAAERETVLARLASSDVLHIAAHARFRADNPLFSYLELSDGRLHVHELESVGTVPDIVVLAACDSAAVAGTGLEFTGFVSVLLGLGVRTVVAAVTPVPDTAATSDVMDWFHEHLASGERPSVALAEAKRSAANTPLGTLSAHTFQVFGWG